MRRLRRKPNISNSSDFQKMVLLSIDFIYFFIVSKYFVTLFVALSHKQGIASYKMT